MSFGDLHNHTTASDGEMSVAELAEWASALGTRVLGVTDHDTLSGVSSFFQQQQSQSPQIAEVVGGVEVSLRFRRDFFTGTLHYLLYVPAPLLADAVFLARAEDVLSQARGAALTSARVDALNAHYGAQALGGRPLDAAEIAAQSRGGVVTRRHFAQALEARGLSAAAARAMCANSSPAYIPSGVEMAALAPLLQQYPQLVRVLAHPAAGSFPGDSHYKEVLPPVDVVERLLPEIESVLGIDGVEAHYPGHTRELTQHVLDWTRERPWLVTGSSDCHDRVHRPLGAGGVPESETRALLAKLQH